VRVSPSGHLRLQRFASQGTGVSSRPSPPRWPRVSYAINRTSIPPRASKLTSKPGAVIVIGVDRHGVATTAPGDASAHWEDARRRCSIPSLPAWTASSYEALRASSLSICSLSKPTIQRLPILITGTPVCPVLRTMSRAASASRSMLISLNGTPRSLK
jgi:hypothetical protein